MIDDADIPSIQLINSYWTCERCNRQLVWLCFYCVFCERYDEILSNPNIVNRLGKENIMTPQEELFSQLFNHEKILVKDMEMLELRAHREQLAKIAFEARARLTAVDDEERTRKKSRAEGEKPSGFERSLNTDETASNAINAIKDRQKRMSKVEKIQAGLEKLGISTADAEKLMSAGTILGRIKNAKGLNQSTDETNKETTKLFNPFEKK